MDLKTIRIGERRTNGDLRHDASDRVRSEAEKARLQAGERGDLLRHQLGERMFDVLTEYFPEEYVARRRSDVIRAFGAGLVVGLAGRELLRR